MANPINDPWAELPLEPEDAHLEHLRGKLGFSRMIEERRARAWLRVASPELQDMALEQQVRFAVERMHRNDESYADISKRLQRQWAAAAQKRFDDGEAARGLPLTKPELEYLSTWLAQANDPVAQSICKKSLTALDSRL